MNFLFFLFYFILFIYINIFSIFLSDKEYNNNCFLFTTNSFQILKLLINNVLNTNLYLTHIYVL